MLTMNHKYPSKPDFFVIFLAFINSSIFEVIGLKVHDLVSALRRFAQVDSDEVNQCVP